MIAFEIIFVGYGLKEDEIDDDKVWKALEKAQLDEFVKGLPEGIDTNLGDRGVRCLADRDRDSE